MQVTTDGYEGRIEKTARIITNDSRSGESFFKVTADIRVPIHVSTPYVLLAGREDEAVTGVVEIRAELDKPLSLTPTAFSLEDDVRYKIEEVEQGRRYILHFTSIPGGRRSYQGYLKLKTNYPERPEVTIRLRGRFKAAS